MIATELAAPAAILTSPTVLTVRPSYEGSNIGAWIGFKHVNYLVEEAVLTHFRDHGFSSRKLYEDYGLGLDVVALDTRIITALHLDEPATARVTPRVATDTPGLMFDITFTVERNGIPTRCVTAKAQAVLRLDDRSWPMVNAPDEIARFVVSTLHAAEDDAGPSLGAADIGVPGASLTDLDSPIADDLAASRADPVLGKLLAGRNAFGWRRRMPYFYCHFSDRVQMSGYLRLMEEVVEKFLAARGISIRTLLDERGWIPVVPHSRIRLLDEARMEEDLYTVFEVEEIFKDFTYRARMDCYVLRDGRLVPAATGAITHGYAAIGGRGEFHLVPFDDRVLQALRREPTTA